MSVSIVSSVPAYGNGAVTSGSFQIQAPNFGNLGVLDIASITGLQPALDAKINDVTTAIGTNVIVTGTELNQLHGAGAITADFSKLHAITASSTELNYSVGVTSSIQTQLNARFRPAGFNATDQIYISTGSGTATVSGFTTVLGAHSISDLGVPTGDVSWGTHKITNVVDPTNPQDAATKHYVDNAAGSGTFLALDGRSTMTGAIVMGGNAITLDVAGARIIGSTNSIHLTTGGAKTFSFNDASLDVSSVKIINVADPVSAQDAMTLHYADQTYLALAGGTMAGAIGMNGFHITLSADALTYAYSPSNGNFAINISAADQLTITAAAIDAHSKPIHNVTDPSSAQDAMTLHYAGQTYLALAGGTMAGALDMGGFALTNAAAPSGATGIGNRSYNDSRYLQASNNLSDVVAATAKTNLGLATVATTGAYGDLSGTPTNVPSVFGRTGPVIAVSDDYTASQITNVAAGNIASVTVQAALNELDTEKLALAGGTMSGALHMGSHLIDGVSVLTAGGTTIDATTIQSNPGGTGYYLRSIASGAAATPTYSFALSQTTGFYWNGSGITTTIAGANKYVMGPTTLDVGGNRITTVGDPTTSGDAVNLSYIQTLNSIRVLGKVTGVDLTTGAGSHVDIYIVPAGANHIITQFVIIATSFIPGAGPVVNPVVNIGISGVNYDQIVSGATLDWGSSGAADQAVYVSPEQGAVVPTTGTTVSLKKTTLAGGTFTALTVDVIVLGILR